MNKLTASTLRWEEKIYFQSVLYTPGNLDVGKDYLEEGSPTKSEATLSRKEQQILNKITRRTETIKAILNDLVHGIEETPKFDVAKI